ncbi:MAG: serine hydrolase domain-containing protein [Fimbriimonadales bacterium]|nr:MAG: serine hydrolase [Fimbriimonadales bacterium]
MKTTLAERLEAIRAESGVPAIAALIGDSKGIRDFAAVGVRRAGTREAVRPEDPFHIGSCTKAMTATAAARLVEQGKLRWETTLADALPQLKPQIHRDYHAVTLRQLLYHRAGLPEDRTADPILFLRLRGLTGDIRQQRLEAVKLVLEKKPAHAPDAQFAYSNFGYMVAGAMLEQATQSSWEQLMQAYLFKPLRMRAAGFGPPESIAGHRGKPPRPQMFDNPPVLGPAGTVHCPLREWAAFARLHLQGARGEKNALLRAESFQTLHADSYQQDYAMGWVLRRVGTERRLLHAGSNTLWFAMAHIAPERNRFYLCAANWGHPDAQNAVVKVIESLSE